MKKQEFLNTLSKEFSLSRKDIETIVAHNLSVSTKELFLLKEVDSKKEKKIKEDIKKYKKGYPLAYIEKKASFMGLDFFVNENVLIPRIDTEVLVLEVGNFLKKSKKKYLVGDIGTGSGCILGSILHYYADYIESAFTLDISKKALKLGKNNIQSYQSNKKVSFYHASFSSLKKILKKEDAFGKGVLLVANLPYIKNGDTGLDKNISSYEPKKALFGGKKTGFELYEKLIGLLIIEKKRYALKSSILFIEIGYDQKNIAQTFLEMKKLSYSFFIDTGGKYRGVFIDF